MYVKKEIVLLGIIFSLLLVSNFVSASLGISPAKEDVNFAPNYKFSVTFAVHSDDPTKLINVSIAGELTQYVTIDTTQIRGDGKVIVTVELPDSIEKPGKNRIWVVVSEIPEEDSGAAIGVAIKLMAAIDVRVPYPGKYLESEFNIPDANINEKIPVEIKVTSRGTETLLINPIVDFYDSSGKQVESMPFSTKELKTNEVKTFRQDLDSAKLKPDNYLAVATIDYGADEKIVLNRTFKIGNLNVIITNFTQNATAGEINKFVIKLKSNWNGKIESIFANVNISNESSGYLFGTSPENLAPWEEKELFGYLDAKEMGPGKYHTEIRLNYQGQTTYSSGELVLFSKGTDNLWIIIGVVFGIMFIIVLYFIIRKMRNKKGRKSK